MTLARTLADLTDIDGNVLVAAGTVGTIRRVIEQEGQPCPDLEVEYTNGVVEVSPADSFEPVER